MNKHLSKVCFIGSAILFVVSLNLFINSLNIINHIHPVTGSIRVSPAIYFGLAGADAIVLYYSGMLALVGVLAMVVFACLIASRDSNDALFSDTVSRY